MVRNLMMIVGLTLAVAAFGCDSDSSEGAAGSGGSGGSGGGGGEGGAAGEGGAGGSAGEGGNGGAPGVPVDQCDADDFAAIEGGEPSTALITACSTGAIGTMGPACVASVNTCIQADDGTTLSEGCSGCFAEAACCTLNQCSVLAVPPGPCAGAPVPGDACDLCIEAMCAGRQAECMGAL